MINITILLSFIDEFGRNCASRSSETYYHGDVNETRQFDVTYRGKDLKYYCASIGFKGSGKGESLRDKYKVCVTPIYFNDPGCAVQLNFTDDVYAETFQVLCVISNKRKKNFTCTHIFLINGYVCMVVIHISFSYHGHYSLNCLLQFICPLPVYWYSKHW